MLNRIKHLKVFIKDADKKSWPKILKEIVHFSWSKKVIPTDYFRKFLYRTDVANPNDYITYKQYNKILLSKKLVFKEISTLLDNKLVFNFLCKEYGLTTPMFLGYNFKNHFYFKDEMFLIKNETDLIKFVDNIFTVTKREKIFIKPIAGIGGSGCFVLDQSNFKIQITKHTAQLLDTSYIFQECIEQHPEINKIYANAINTLRIITYIDTNLIPHIVSVCMRFGMGDSITDNMSTGGFVIGVLEEGTLKEKGLQETKFGGHVFAQHPDSKFKLKGFKIPQFKEACDLAINATSYFPNRVVGWDVAISNNGPLLIEGNHNPSLQASDIVYGGYCTHPLIKEILEVIE